MIDGQKVKADFPIFSHWEKENGHALIYLDNAATTQKPVQVIDRLNEYYRSENANVHRGMYQLSQTATEAYEQARQRVQQFIGAKSPKEIVFTRGTTDALNQLAYMLTGEVDADSEILISEMEHHSNIIPWQQLAKRTGAKLRYIELTADGLLDLTHLKSLLSSRTKIVSLTHVSNVLGTINPIKEIGQWVHEQGAYFIVDGAQAVPHFAVDVQDLDVDFYALSGHKMYGPTGIGVLYGKQKLLEQLPPSQFGGEMIRRVDDFDSTWADLPQKFEAGTPPIAEAIGLSEAINFMDFYGLSEITKQQELLTDYALEKLRAIDGLTIYGPLDAKKRVGTLSFNLDTIHAHDLTTALDTLGIAIRAGHHCAQPLMRTLGVVATARMSLAIYNTPQEIDQFADAIMQIKEFFTDGLS